MPLGETQILPLPPIADWTWKTKYRQAEEKARADTFKRVCKGVYQGDPQGAKQAEEAFALMDRQVMLPAGRITTGAGTDRLVTWINCYVICEILDSMKDEVVDGVKRIGIMGALSVSAFAMQMGGGTGQDFTPLRPRGAVVVAAGSVSSGTIHFMDMWNAMCGTVMAAGSRRGAMMTTLAIDHPDLWHPNQFEVDPDTGILKHPTFISAKRQKDRLKSFNMSVLVSAAFMEAKAKGETWDLGHEKPHHEEPPVEVLQRNGKPWYVYQRVPAQRIWDDILYNTYKYAEPGVIFIDRVNEWNNLWYCENIRCTNPCGEQPLPPYGDCNLGHQNLAAVVKRPFEPSAEIDQELIARAVRTAIRFHDNVVENSPYPTVEFEQEAKSKRRIGYGVTGLANLLQMMCIRYGSPESIQVTEMIMRIIRDEAYRTSIELAKERGPFPLFQRENYLKGKFIKTLPEDIQELIAQHGIRNALLLTIAPVGTGSLFFGNVSSGIEPTYSGKPYYRKVLEPDDTFSEFRVQDRGFALYEELVAPIKDWDKDRPPFMCDTKDLTVEDHLVVMAACQKYVDASISKTINIPTEYSFAQFKQVYDRAYELDLKSCTTYRFDPDSGRGSVLSDEATLIRPQPKGERPTHQPAQMTRPEVLNGRTYKLKWPAINFPFFLTINNWTDDEGWEWPYEVFLNSKSVANIDLVSGITRLTSSIFRRGGDTTFLIEELENSYAAQGGQWINGKYVPSIVALIGQVIARHMRDLGMMPHEPERATDLLPEGSSYALVATEKGPALGEICPQCNQPTLVHLDGCDKCDCGYSTCG